MKFSIFAFLFIKESFCFTCPKNWQYESSSGKCMQTGLAIICTEDSVVVVAEVDDLYFKLPKQNEADTRLQIGSCIGQTGPFFSRYVEVFGLDECNPTLTADYDGIKAAWEVTGTSIAEFKDVYKYSLSCLIRTNLEEEVINIEGVTDEPNLILKTFNTESNQTILYF
ncbi:unnamed protein product [Oikopleura dioica]|uniref:ZP domain-containing protein n=1 Tax=Oikopleura dioica TaxID=34765 RepID=E4X153_OIKDI|nr:unnamed protein product [Oikopleura dioica]